MNKLTSIGSLALAASLFLAACGSGGSSSNPASTETATDTAGTDSASTRTISGTLTGDLTNISGVRAVRTSDAVIFEATITTSARTKSLIGTAADFQVTVPTNNNYTLDVLGTNNTPVASVQFSTSPTGTNTTNQIPVTGGTTADIALGAINVPAGTGAATDTTTTAVTITPTTNPLTQVDSDDDGVNDFEDDDDDNDGIDDDLDDDSDDDSDSDSIGDDSNDDDSNDDDSNDDDSNDDDSEDDSDNL